MFNFKEEDKQMSFIEHTIWWYKGEVLESVITCCCGVLLMIIAFAFWRFGQTPGAQAVVIPLMVVGLILGGSGGYNAYTNQKMVNDLKLDNNQVEREYVQSEKERVEGFQYLYMFTKYLAVVLFLGAVVIFFLTEKWAQSIGVGMIILGLSGLVIDYFSKERADQYYQIILDHHQL